MAMYRKKPVVIEARQLRPDIVTNIATWCGGATRGVSLPREQWAVDIETLEGTMRAEMGDWIIKGVKGEFYPCKPDIFEATYEVA